MFRSHKQWWDGFWAHSEVTIPDERIQRHYNLVKYFYGAASRPDAPSMPLQAVWTQDSGGLPPWKGDFHHDLNTQMTYLAYHKAGLVDSGMSFINHMWDLMPEYRTFSQEFFGVDGAAVPTVMTLNGKPLGGWPQYTLSPTYAIWIGQSFYLHWKHTMDGEFLRERAYPWMDEIVSTIVRLLEEKDGKLYLPLSSSSEIFDASPRAFLKPNSNQDLSMLQWAFDAMAEMADALGKESDVTRWRALRSKLNDLHVDNNILMFSSNEPFNQSHRHHAHAMAIHPFATLNIDGTEKDRQVIQATLKKMDRTWYTGLDRIQLLVVCLPACPRGTAGTGVSIPDLLRTGLHPAQRFPCQRRSDRHRAFRILLPPVYARRQLPGHGGRARHGPAKLAGQYRRGSYAGNPHFPRHALAVAPGKLPRSSLRGRIRGLRRNGRTTPPRTSRFKPPSTGSCVCATISTGESPLSTVR